MSASICPQCKSPLTRTEVQRSGLLHARRMSSGGPFYTFACPRCAVKLLVEIDSVGTLRISESKDLSRRPRLRSILEFFLGPPQPTSESNPKSPHRSERVHSKRLVETRSGAKSTRTTNPDSSLLTLLEREWLARVSKMRCHTVDDARREYRRFVKENHPDRFMNRSPTEREAAETEFRRTHAEFQRLIKRIERRERGAR